MALTRADLAEHALETLLVVGAGQSPDSEDIETADGAIDSLFADLSGRGIYSVADDQDIDLAAFGWLTDLLADTIAAKFGQQATRGRSDNAEAKLKWLTASRPSREPLVVDYF